MVGPQCGECKEGCQVVGPQCGEYSCHTTTDHVMSDCMSDISLTLHSG